MGLAFGVGKVSGTALSPDPLPFCRTNPELSLKIIQLRFPDRLCRQSTYFFPSGTLPMVLLALFIDAAKTIFWIDIPRENAASRNSADSDSVSFSGNVIIFCVLVFIYPSFLLIC
jgi:hypothetical protein